MGSLANNATTGSPSAWTGAWRDNVFAERLWHSVKYEVYLRAYDSISDARVSITHVERVSFGRSTL